MFRWPTIIRLFTEGPLTRFLLLMEEPKGSIYRAYVSVADVHDAEAVAAAMARGWASIWNDVAAGRKAPEGESLDAVDVEITPHWTMSKDVLIDTKNLVLRPGKFIPVDGNILDVHIDTAFGVTPTKGVEP